MSDGFDEDDIFEEFTIGDIVSSSNEDFPLRSTYAWYRTAIVVSTNPLVLVSLDRTMRWDNFPPEFLVVEGQASPKRLRLCSIKYHNDDYLVREAKNRRPKGSLDYEYLILGDSLHTVEQVFESLKPQCLLQKRMGTFEVKPKFIVKLDALTVRSITFGMGCVVFATDGEAISLIATKPFYNKLTVYALVYQG